MAIIRFHREGRGWIAGSLLAGPALGGILYLTHASWAISLPLGLGWLIWTGLILNFFRYPNRICPAEPNTLYAPCDGKVVEVKRTFEPKYFHCEMVQISIFMSPFNVHVNWAPAAGTVRQKQHSPGFYKVAWHPKASLLNEQTFLAVEREVGRVYALRQIAGILARRIRTYPEKDQLIRQGEEIGFIKFGSRVDVLLPPSVHVLVRIGQPVRGALTPIAVWQESASFPPSSESRGR